MFSGSEISWNDGITFCVPCLKTPYLLLHWEEKRRTCSAPCCDSETLFVECRMNWQQSESCRNVMENHSCAYRSQCNEVICTPCKVGAMHCLPGTRIPLDPTDKEAVWLTDRAQSSSSTLAAWKLATDCHEEKLPSSLILKMCSKRRARENTVNMSLLSYHESLFEQLLKQLLQNVRFIDTS